MGYSSTIYLGHILQIIFVQKPFRVDLKEREVVWSEDFKNQTLQVLGSHFGLLDKRVMKLLGDVFFFCFYLWVMGLNLYAFTRLEETLKYWCDFL